MTKKERRQLNKLEKAYRRVQLIEADLGFGLSEVRALRLDFSAQTIGFLDNAWKQKGLPRSERRRNARQLAGGSR